MIETKPTAGALRAARACAIYVDETDNPELEQVALIIDHETVGPKVEEIIETILRANDAKDYGDWCDWDKLVAKAREVSAALGGKAE